MGRSYTPPYAPIRARPRVSSNETAPFQFNLRAGRYPGMKGVFTMSTTTNNTLTTATRPLPSFKNKALLAYSRDIEKSLSTMTDSTKAIAVTLGHVLKEECYKDDGFDSVADYAEQVFGIARAQAYKMARTAVRFMLPDSPLSSNETIKALPLNNLAELNAVEDDDAIAADIADGKLKADSKQSEIRDLANTHKPAKILKGDRYRLYTPDGKEVDGVDYYAAQIVKALQTTDETRVIVCDPLKDQKGNVVVRRFVTVDTKTARAASFVAKVSIPAKSAKAPKSSPVTVTPGDAVAAAVENYKKSHNGKEPTMAELMAMLVK